ncbi:MAG TPA: S8 family serine peptidase [Terriglobales bacterium]|jgi:hypothetical protein|nr:S8 family serine peptidase [Terriglobales bacterium]
MTARRPTLILLCAVAMVACHLKSMCSEAPVIPPLRTVTDLAVATNGNRVSTVYVADKDAGAIYSAEFAANSVVKFSDFHPIFASPKYAQPIAIAYDNGNLFICDATAGVFSLDLTSRAIQPILGALDVRQPTSIAVLNGRIAISDRGKKGVFLLSLDGSPVSFTEIPSAERLGRIVLYDQQVAVLDEGLGTLWGITKNPYDRTSLPTASILLISPNLSDFRVADGVFYLDNGSYRTTLEKGNLGGRGLSLLLPRSGVSDGSLDTLAIDQGGFFLVRSAASEIERVPAQVPVKVSFSSETTASNDALILLYKYLWSNHILPMLRVPVYSGKSLESVLLEENVVLPPFSAIQARSLKGLLDLLCEMDKTACNIDSTRSGPLFNRVRFLQVPSIALTSFLTTEVKTFKGQSFKQYVSDNISPRLVEDAMERFRSLEKVADPRPTSVDDYFKAQGFIALTAPTANLQPGRLLALHSDNDPNPSSLDCSGFKGVPVSSEPVNLPKSSVSAKVHFGSGIVTDPDVISSEEVHADQAVIETIGGEDLSKYINTGACGSLSAYGPVKVIVQAIKVLGLRYRFTDNRGKIISVDPEKLAAVGISSHSDPEGVWSLIVDSPVYVAYKATDPVSWNNSTAAPPKLEEGTKLYGQYVVPSEVWEVRVMILKRDLTDPQSALMKIHNPSQGIYVLPAESIRAKAGSPDVPGNPVANSEGLGAAQRDRASLFASIHYEVALLPDEASMSTTYVAIGENVQSVDFQHTAFWDAANKSSWWTLGERDAGLVSVLRSSAPPNTPEATAPFSEPQDHGSHVAGLLGARSGRLGSGLIPNAPLVFLDTSDIGNTPGLIDRALGLNVRLFNFSFEQILPPEAQSIYESLKQKITSSTFALFVVAAGNEGRKVSGAFVPIGFGEDQPNNVIGVAAADGLHKLDEWFDDSGRIEIGTNYGAKYVQLLAPGKSIYSLGHNNGYANATGSSQAVPQVTAAAAVLFAEGHTDPWKIKQRLMCTADWLENFRSFAWGGGLLNFHRAVWHTEKNLWKGQTLPDQIYSFTINGTPPVKISGAVFDQPDGLSDGSVPSQIFFPNILRISTQSDKKLRIVYLDNDHLRIIKDATLSGVIKCSNYQLWDNSAQQFKPADPDLCAIDGVRSEQVFDYVAKMN